MIEAKVAAVLRAGVLFGLGAGLALGCGAMMLAQATGAWTRVSALEPLVLTLGAVPVVCIVGGVQLLKKAKARP